MDYFIEFEWGDWRARTAAPRDRITPDASSYLQHQRDTGAVGEDAEHPLYVRYALAPEEWPLLDAQVTGEKGWHGP